MLSNRLLASVYIAALFAGLALLLFQANMLKGLNHDEHMYVAAGALLSREGLLPYRDFPYFQMPNLPFVYAGLFSTTSYLLLAARLFSTLCALALCGVLFGAAWRAFRTRALVARLLAGTGAVMLLVSNQTFVYASGLAWNHDLAALLGVLAFILFMRGARLISWRWVTGAGVMLGLALGTRLTMGAMFVPLFIILLAMPGVSGAGARGRTLLHERLRLLAALLGGTALALAPSIVLFALSPDRFLFSNIGYHALNEEYQIKAGYTRAVDAGGKLQYLVDVFTVPGTLALVALVAVVAVPALAKLPGLMGLYRFNVVAALLVALALLAGALFTAPVWLQYFYVAVPFLILACVYSVADVAPNRALSHATYAFSLLFLASIVWLGAGYYVGEGMLLYPGRWVPVRAHAVGELLERSLRYRRVLTLSPIYALEAGFPIYPAFASGPFAWRSGPLLTRQERAEFGIVAAPDLREYVGARFPAFPAIVTGDEGLLEEPLVRYALAERYGELRAPYGITLWAPLGGR